VQEVATTSKTQAPPPHVLWEELAAPRTTGSRIWLRLRDGETQPTVIEAHRPELVVWSSLWPDRPKDRIRFDISSDGWGGSRLRWTLVAAGSDLPDPRIREMRYRLNQLINAELRDAFDQ
jgi:hypothetical protein